MASDSREPLMTISDSKIMANENIKLVNNTGVDVSGFAEALNKAVDEGVLPEEFEGVFELKILAGFNPDGSDRGLLEMA